MTLSITLDADSVRSALGHVEKSVKRDNSQVSLVVPKRGDHVWLEGHGPFRHLQIRVESSKINTDGQVNGVTVETKTLQQLVRGAAPLELIASEKEIRFRRRGKSGNLTGKLASMSYEGKMTNPKGRVKEEVRVDLTDDQASSIADALKHVSVRNAIAKDKEMELWLRMNEKGTRVMVFDQWHSAGITLPSVTSAEPVAMHVDRDLFTAVIALAGSKWSLRAGSDFIRASDETFALRSSIVESYDGPTDSEMSKIIANARKSAGEASTPKLTVDASDLKEIYTDLGITNLTESIQLSLAKGKVVWSCQGAGGSKASVSQDAKAMKAKGKWEEPFKISPNLFGDLLQAVPDGPVSMGFVDSICLMQVKADSLSANYLMMLS